LPATVAVQRESGNSEHGEQLLCVSRIDPY
jgi:hypothetical protein